MASVKDTQPVSEGRKEMFYLTIHSTHFIYGYMASVNDHSAREWRKEGNVLFNDALNTFYLQLYGISKGPLIQWVKEGNVLFNNALNTFYFWLYGFSKGHSSSEWRKEMFYLTMHSTHFIYGYMASDIW